MKNMRDLMKFTTLSMMLATLFVVWIPLSSEGEFSGDSNMTNHNSNVSGFQPTCSTWIGVAVEEGLENNTDIPCLQTVFEKCQPFDTTLGYALGSRRVLVRRLTNDGSDCSLNLAYEIEMGGSNLTCTIPLAKMSTWTNWKRGDGLDAVDQINKDYCNK